MRQIVKLISYIQMCLLVDLLFSQPVFVTTDAVSLVHHPKQSNSQSILSSSSHLISRQINCDKKNIDPFLWKITSNGSEKPAYLFGTIHVAYTRVWDFIPDIVIQTFRESDNAYFELDLLEPSITSDMNDCKYLPKGEKLVNILPADLYARLVNHLHYIRNMMPRWISSSNRKYRGAEAHNLFRAKTAQWQRKHVIWTLLMIDSLTESDIRSHGTSTLDYYLAQEAQRMGKKTGAVESVEDQCEPLNNLNLTHVIFALNMTLLQHEKIRRGLIRGTHANEALIDEYKCGNIDLLMLNQDMSSSHDDAELARQIEEYFQEKFIKERNKKMTKKIITLLTTQPSKIFFFAFGVAHFLGNNSIVDLLKTHGYNVERVYNSESNFRQKNMSYLRKPRCSKSSDSLCTLNSTPKGKVTLLRRNESLIARFESRNKRNHKIETSHNFNNPLSRNESPEYHAHRRKIVEKLNRELYKHKHGLSSLNKNKVFVVLPIERLSSLQGMNRDWSAWSYSAAASRKPLLSSWFTWITFLLLFKLFHR